MEARRAAGEAFDVREILGLAVPLCTHLANLHAQGKAFFVHPSSLRYSQGGIELDEERAQTPPAMPRDRACLAPEQRATNGAGDAKASVFALGALLYEMLTNASVGPGMRRPIEVVPDLPAQFELILGKALVADAKHRPGDLGALAQALHQILPGASMAPPPADPSQLDIEVDIRLSMIPMNERPGQPGTDVAIPKAAKVPQIQQVTGDGPFAVAIRKEDPAQRGNNPTQRLADMKARLESDPRPRYVVVKDGMDHGPFSAVELLQQIATGSFTEDMPLRDAFSQEQRAIKDWEEFAPFAEQAKLNRAIVQEKKALEQVVAEEKRGTQYKALIGLAVIGVFAAGGLGWWMRERNSKERALEVQADQAVAVDVADAGLASGKGGPSGAGGPRSGGGSGFHPVIAGGTSCEAARARYVEEYKMGDNGPADLTAGAYGAVLNKGTYLNSCGVPSSTSVTVCAAVQNGRAVGVTVTLNPPNPGVASCVAGQIRSMGFPSHPRLDVTTTTFAAN